MSSEHRTELYTSPAQVFYSVSETVILCVLYKDSDENHYFVRCLTVTLRGLRLFEIELKREYLVL